MTLYHGEETSSRFKILDNPNIEPGYCAVCGNPRGPVLDFGRNLDYYGSVLICLECLNAAAEKAGLYEARGIQIGVGMAASDNLMTLAANIREIKEAEDDIVAGFNRFNLMFNLLLSFNGVPAEIPTEPTEGQSRPDSVNGQNGDPISNEGTISVPSNTSDESESGGARPIARFTV